MTIHIRPARETDAETVARLVRGERLNPTGLDWRNFSVAEDEDVGGGIVGAVQIRPHGPELGSLVVRADRRGRGVASRLIAAALERAESAVFVICPTALAGLYQRRGFRPTPPLATPRSVRLHYLIGQASMALAPLRRRRPRRLVVLQRPGGKAA